MIMSKHNDNSTTESTIFYDGPQRQDKPAKKRPRGRRRKNVSKNETTIITGTTVNNCGGYISESSSESSKRSIAQKKSKAVPVSLEEKAKYLALDCEMVGVGADGLRSTLARVTVVNWDGDIVYDTFIRPMETVTDYRTFVSGITAADFDNDDLVTDFCSCRTRVLEILQNKILVGHALKNDLSALQIKHPWQQIRDTAKYEPFMKQRFDDSIYWPRKLKELVYEYVNGMIIQQPGQPHCSFEDAYAAMQLYQSVRNKWEKVMTYKIRKTAEIEQQKRLPCVIIQLDESSIDSGALISTLHNARKEDFQQEITWPKLVAQNA